MANISYLSLSGETQGLISAGCSTLDSVGNKAQPEHKDQIMVYALMHSISRSQNVNHHELIITKPVDKSSPLLAKALSDNEKMAICEFILYRTSKAGIYQLNRPGFPGECFICELRLPDHRFRWKHNKLFLLLPEEYGPAFPAIVDCYTSPPTLVWPVPLLHGFSSSYGVLPPLCKDH